jgi:hypothetical protein
MEKDKGITGDGCVKTEKTESEKKGKEDKIKK